MSASVLLPYCREVKEGSFYQDFHRGISEALRDFGYDPVPFSFARMDQLSPDEARVLFQLLKRVEPAAVIDVACWGSVTSRVQVENLNGGTQLLFHAFAIPYVALVCDQPYNQAINGIYAAKLYAGYPDLDHPQQVRLAFPGLQRLDEFFVPPGVRPQNDRSAEQWSSQRDIDVLYVGNLNVEASVRFWHQPTNPWHGQLDPGFCDCLVDTVLSEPERSLHRSVHMAVSAFGVVRPGFNANLHLRASELHLRHLFRRDAVVALADSGIRMSVAGSGWDQIALPRTVDRLPETNYEGLFRLAGRAQLCLDVSTYLDGANDRVFSYLLNHALCFTNAAGYLRHAFGDDQGLDFYSMRKLHEVAERIRSALARPDARRDAAERGHQIVVASHSWKQRVAHILRSVGLPLSRPSVPATTPGVQLRYSIGSPGLQALQTQ
jgi:hypothetical protein